jgi:hypothetical protein
VHGKWVQEYNGVGREEAGEGNTQDEGRGEVSGETETDDLRDNAQEKIGERDHEEDRTDTQERGDNGSTDTKSGRSRWGKGTSEESGQRDDGLGRGRRKNTTMNGADEVLESGR